MYEATRYDRYYAVSIVDDKSEVITIVSIHNTEHEADYWCEKLNTSYDAGYDNGYQLSNIIQDEDVPQWLRNDIRLLGLEDVRLSCAIFDLYEYYANTKYNNINVSDLSDYLTLVNERLDWIDANTDIIQYAINKLWKNNGKGD